MCGRGVVSVPPLDGRWPHVQNRQTVRPLSRHLLLRLCALVLLVLAGSPFTFPFGTCDLAPAQHDWAGSAPAAKVKEPDGASLAVPVCTPQLGLASGFGLAPGRQSHSAPVHLLTPIIVLRI